MWLARGINDVTKGRTDQWLSHAPSSHSDQHSGTVAMTAVTVGDISQEVIGDFWRHKDYISSPSKPK